MLLKSVFWSAISAVMFSVFRFALNAILANKVDPFDYGKYIYIFWIVETTYLFFVLGRNHANGRSIAENLSKPEELNNALELWSKDRNIISIVSAVAAVVVTSILVYRVSWYGFSLIFILAWLMSMQYMQTTALSAMRRFRTSFYANLAYGVVVILSFFVIDLFDGLSGLDLSLTISSLGALGAFIVVCLSDKRIFLYSIFIIKPNYLFLWRRDKYALNSWITTLLFSMAWARGEFPIVKEFFGELSLATYGVATTLMGLGTQACALFVGGVLPYITSLNSRGEQDKCSLIIEFVSAVQIFISMVLCFLIIVFKNQIVLLFFGERYAAAADLLAVLSLTLPALMASVPAHLVQLKTDGRDTRNALISTYLFLMVLSLFAANFWSLIGIPIARVVALFLYAMVIMYFYSRVSENYIAVFRNGVLGWLSCLLIYIYDYYVGHSIFLASCFSLSMFIVCFYFFRVGGLSPLVILASKNNRRELLNKLARSSE